MEAEKCSLECGSQTLDSVGLTGGHERCLDFPFHVDSSDLFSFEHIEPNLEGKLAHNHSS